MSELNRESQLPHDPQEASEVALERILSAGMGSCPPPALLFALSEDVLPAEQTALIQDHLTHCGVCRLLLADTAMDEEDRLTAHQSARIDGLLQERIARRVGATRAGVSRSSTSSRGWHMANLAIAAGLIVAVVLTGIWLHGRGTHTATAAIQPRQPSLSPGVGTKATLLELATVEPLAPPAAKASDLLARGTDSASADEPTAAEMMPAFRAYNRRDYTTAVAAFRLITERYPKTQLPALYMGVSQLELQDNAGAAQTLLPLTSSADSTNDALWYAAVAETRLGSPVATELFRRICAERPAYAHAAESCRLATELKP